MTRVLLIGSAPNSVIARKWDRKNFDKISAINNAWRVREDWNDLIYPHDLLPERLPKKIKKGQQLIDENKFVPAQNKYGGFIYAGGTMAFTAAYWILDYYKPKIIVIEIPDQHPDFIHNQKFLEKCSRIRRVLNTNYKLVMQDIVDNVYIRNDL